MTKKVENVMSNDAISQSILHQWYVVAKGYSVQNRMTIQEVVGIIADETTKAINRDLDPEAEIIFEIDDEKEQVKILNLNMSVVEDEFEFESEKDVQHISFVTISEAKNIYPDVKIDDVIKWEISFDLLTEKCKTAIKNGFVQRLKANKKAEVYLKYEPLIGTKIKAQILSRNKDGSYNLSFEDNVTAFLPFTNINPKLSLKPGSLIDVYVEQVNEDTRLSQVHVSIDSPRLVYDLLKNEVPEIAEGLIEVVDIQRVPGVRTKISISDNNPELGYDIIGLVIGNGGRRILSIIDKLGGEKIDVIRYSEDKIEYIKNAISPGKVLDVVPHEKFENAYYAIVENDKDMFVSVGRGAINVNLAKKLTNTRIELIRIEDAVEKNIQFNRKKIIERPLIGKGSRDHKSMLKKSKTSTYFDGIDIDINDFAKDVSQFLESQRNYSSNTTKDFEKKSESKTDENKPRTPKQRSYDFDKIFDTELNNIETLTSSYDFLDKIDDSKIFDDNEENEFIDETTVELVKPIVEKTDIKQGYKKAKNILKDFKEDTDLKNYGLESDLDLSGFDDDWEK